MALRELAGAEAALDWLVACGARALALDSRRVQPGDAFIAWPGHAVDPRRFVADALAAGAVACLVEADGVGAFEGLADDARVAALRGLKAAAGPIADGFLGRPSRRLHVLAVTGTNGKTSTAWWLAQALGRLGRRCGVVGTLGVGEPPAGGAAPAVVPTGLTTPDPVALQTAFRRFADEGFDACAIEASSIGIEEERLTGTQVEVALFTNLTQDHLDYHGSMDAYRAAKAKLFAWPGLRHAVLNVDDAEGAALARSLALASEKASDGDGLDLWTVSALDGTAARLAARAIRHGDGGMTFDVHEAGTAGDSAPARVTTRLVGAFNVSNLLGVIGGLRALGVPLADAAHACAALTPVPGRMQRVTLEGADGAGDDALPQVVVDYAHTPDALEKALAALRPMADGRGGRLGCVFGCGGNRDATKRPRMGAIAARLADRTVVTSDNPRDEAPAAIVAQVKAGADTVAGARVEVVIDRAEAIARAFSDAGPRDVVLIAGKGHEEYQEIAGVKRPFSDIAVAQGLLRRRASDMNLLSCEAGA